MHLYEHVLQHCAQRSWFGTDSMLWSHQRHSPSLPYDSGGLAEHFYYATATEEELQATESVLGFPLPQELRSLYQHVANGGFGPDQGIIGLTNGCTIAFLQGYPSISNWAASERTSEVHLADVYRIQTHQTNFVDLEAYVSSIQKQGWVELPYTVFPHNLCTFGYANNAMGYVIDAIMGAIYRCEGATASSYRLTYLAASLEEWLQPWLRGTWTSPFTERIATFHPSSIESPALRQQRLMVIEQIQQSLYREPRQFHGPHAALLERIYQRCLLLGGLIFRPATKAQVQLAEVRLGQPFPSLLHDVYLQIGNGGFGPAYGLHGLEGGYPYLEGRYLYGEQTIVDSLLPEDGTIRGIQVHDYEDEIQQTGAFILKSGGPLPYTEPQGCICICDDGCGMFSWLHVASQRIFQSYAWGTMQMHYSLEHLSLESWFDVWLTEEVQQSLWSLHDMINHVAMGERIR